MSRKFLFVGTLTVIISLFSAFAGVEGAPGNLFCSVYFSQIGCIHCAVSDPFLFKEFLPRHPNVVIIEYELAQRPINGRIMLAYDNHYGKEGWGGFVVPQILSGKGDFIVGDGPIVSEFEKYISDRTNFCPFPEGSVSAERLSLNSLPLDPVIWRDRRVLFRSDKAKSVSDELLRRLFFADDIDTELVNIKHERIDSVAMAYSGGEVRFKNAVRLGGWILQWR